MEDGSDLRRSPGEEWLDCTEEDVIADLRVAMFPDRVGLYHGPGSFTAAELQDALNLNTHEKARYRARQAVKRGEMVEVRVLRTKHNGGEYTSQAWVLREIYEAWRQERGDDGG